MKNDSESPNPGPAFGARRDDLDWPLHAGAAEEILAGLEQRANRRVRRRMAWGGVAMALLVGGAWILSTKPPAAQLAAVPPAAPVTVIQPESQVLPDGSTVEFRRGAQIKVSFTDAFRRVELLSGEAHFTVTKNPLRPFLVGVGNLEVRAVGTAFSVQRAPQSIEVVVTEGRVAVEKSASERSGETASPPIVPALDAGYRAVVSTASSEALEVEHMDDSALESRMAWRVPRLEFSATPLASVIEQFNQHNRAHFVLADAKMGGLRLTGSLRADRVDALLDVLATDFGIRAERSDGRIILHAPVK